MLKNVAPEQVAPFIFHEHPQTMALILSQLDPVEGAPYPPERTLLTTGIIDAAMNSRSEGHHLVETPYLNISDESYDEMPVRPRGERPSGATVDPDAPDIILDGSMEMIQ